MVVHPVSLWFFAILIPTTVIFIRNFRRGRQSFSRLGGEWGKNKLYDVYITKSFFSILVFSLFLVFLILSLAGFSHSKRKLVEAPSGDDIVFAIDISRSMLGNDIPPSRLKYSLNLIGTVVGKIPSQRYGIVVFKGKGAKMIPLTEDAGAVLNSLSSISPDILTSRGTSIEEGLRTAASSFPSGDNRKKFIILFTDGDDLSGDPGKAAMEIRSRGIEVLVVGTGTEKGVPLISGGKKIVSKLDKPLLKYIASVLKGYYLDASNKNSSISVVSILEKDLSGSRIETIDEDSYMLTLSLALIFLFLHIIIRIFPWKKVL